MQNEAKLESGPIFDFGGPWWPRWPGFRLSKTNTEMAHTYGYVDASFRALALIVLAVRMRKPGSTLIVARTTTIIKRIVPIL